MIEEGTLSFLSLTIFSFHLKGVSYYLNLFCCWIVIDVVVILRRDGGDHAADCIGYRNGEG